ncbi:hypothetical protein CDAR_447421 [Caerostris darwini]|uniref:Uncharacterized protein n=1 Tax=Caerostris darwini TaxID=1538125 RepID=A0AAV4PSX6_9ARAC|nr:hypothetical protein CDAR_447421 [Caerostris darwini]
MKTFTFAENAFETSKVLKTAVGLKSLHLLVSYIIYETMKIKYLPTEQTSQLNASLESFSDAFRPEKRSNPKIQRYFKAGSNLLVSLPPYLSPAKKQKLVTFVL